MKKRAFTLVELLVVIAIIAVLISILLSALNKARRHARAVQCGSQLRQLGIGFMLYAHDSGGRLPYAVNYDQQKGYLCTWQQAIDRYIGGQGGPNLTPTSRLFACPDDISGGPTVSSYLMIAGPTGGLGQGWPNDWKPECRGLGYYSFVNPDGTYNSLSSSAYPPPRLSKIRNRAKTLLLVESHGWPLASPWHAAQLPRWAQCNYQQFGNDAARWAPHGKGRDNYGWPAGVSISSPDIKWNWLFDDGHVEMLLRSETENWQTPFSPFAQVGNKYWAYDNYNRVYPWDP